ncbi:MAG: GNAT superfamily N-acetyltransferase [Planctomycetota bacterium]|jgi:GNAT superfamily N-acetyltransferase
MLALRFGGATVLKYEVKVIACKKHLRQFIDLPYRLHSAEKHFVPPLLFDVKARLDKQKNPFFKHAEAEYFIALDGDRCVGRIAAIENRRHNEIHKDGVGFFGWFESENNPEIAKALLDRAAQWLSDRGLDQMRGPVSFSMNDEVGILVKGFDWRQTVLTAWNPPWYEDLITGYGLEKVMDLISFSLPVMEFGAERMERIIERIKKRENLSVRPFDMKKFPDEVKRFKDIYEDAWMENWGHVGLTNAEIDHMAKEMKPIVEAKLANFVEVDGHPVGFSLVLPDIYYITQNLKGKLFPFGLFKLLFGMKKIPDIRLLAMGIRRDMQRRGLDSVLYYESFRAARDLGKKWSELGWVLETNTVMINTIEKLGGTAHKTHRLYQRPLDSSRGIESPV